MEMEVRCVAGIANCYVSLPLSLLQSLQSSTHPLPPFLPLQLISPSSGDVICHVAWSGSSSSSPSIEIAQEFAACIGLEDRTVVRVRALPNVPKASLVTIEPLTEDDWEVVELNAEIAEAAILGQVRIIHGKMRFPLWLHGDRIVTFTVVSMVPDKTVVQLVPGTEVAVAPKRRKKNTDQYKNSNMDHSNGALGLQRVLLRVQDPEDRLIDKTDYGGGTIDVELTTVAFIHPDTAKNYLFESLQLVVLVPRLQSKINVENSGNNSPAKQDSSSEKDMNRKSLTNEKDVRYAVVRLVASESTAKGHLMLCQSLRRYLRVSFHSWLYVRTYAVTPKKGVSQYVISPCQFVIPSKNKDSQNSSTDMLDDSIDLEERSSTLWSNHDVGAPDWSLGQELASAPSERSADFVDKEIGALSNAKDRLKGLLHAWVMAQFRVINSMTGVKSTSLVLGPTSFLSFELVTNAPLSGNKHKQTASTTKFLYMLNASEELSLGQKYIAYELTIGENQSTGVQDNLKFLFENLSLGSFVSYDTCNDDIFSKNCTSTISSLDWMGAATSDVTNRLTLLLSPGCGAWFSDLNLPLPGHVLIYGPPGSGKTLLASAVSESLEENKAILAHTIGR